jgi:lysophospholipase L1-like esterase
MTRMVNYLFLAFCLCCSGCATSKINKTTFGSLPATSLHAYGRYAVDKQQNLQLISSAVHFGFSFEGTTCNVFASLPYKEGHNYIQYELDGEYKRKLRIEGHSTAPIVITAPTAGKHTIWIYKTTEAHTGAIIIQKITGHNIKSIKRPSAPLIEFIGNSITCGAAADPSEVACGKGVYHDQHNAYYAYGPRVARALKTNFMVSSVSGIGVYRNWNSLSPTMPQVYEKIDFQDKTNDLWNFKLLPPNVVSIALGTNDFSKGDGKKERLPFDSAVFVNSYVSFVEKVKSKYPKAQIALLSSPMFNGSSRTTLQNCLTAVKEKIDGLHPESKKIALHFFAPMQVHGCSGHPSVEDHAVLAEELIPFFDKLL